MILQILFIGPADLDRYGNITDVITTGASQATASQQAQLPYAGTDFCLFRCSILISAYYQPNSSIGRPPSLLKPFLVTIQ